MKTIIYGAFVCVLILLIFWLVGSLGWSFFGEENINTFGLILFGLLLSVCLALILTLFYLLGQLFTI